MPQLLKIRFVSIGHPQARMDDLVLDLRGSDGRSTDSTLWLRNGGGKSSILNLFFAIVRPHKGEFLGGKAEAKQRSLNDYILSSDRAVTAAEWQLDPAVDSLDLELERFVTGVFYERREGSGDMRRLFFACRVSGDHPETALGGLPIYTTTAGGAQTRRTLGAFREAWRSLRDKAPHLGVADTENQREWQEILEAARIDPELYSYQVRMNQREGGADELFRFSEPEEFIDFLLALALDPALGDRVGRNITAFRRELLQRKEKLVPERELVTGLLDRMNRVVEVSRRREQLRQRLGITREELSTLDALASTRIGELDAETKLAEDDCAAHLSAARAENIQAEDKRTRATLLRRHAAELRLRKLEEDHEQAQEEWKLAQRMARIWSAAVPLRKALLFEEKAREQRRLLEHRRSEFAPLRADLEKTAARYASALSFRSKEYRRTVDESRNMEAHVREEARAYQRQSKEAGKVQTKAETEASGFKERLAEVHIRLQRLVSEGLIGVNDSPDVALSAWSSRARDHEEAIRRIEDDIVCADDTLDALEDAIAGANAALGEIKTEHEKLSDRYRRADDERRDIENDEVLLTALELESIDADRIGNDAISTLERAARTAQKNAVEARLAIADDARAALHIEEHGLLPPSTDAQQLIEFLGSHLGGQAWSGWSWIQANVPKDKAHDTVRESPALAQGVVVRPSDFDRASELIHNSGVEPEGPVLLADTSALSRFPKMPGRVIGPKESAWFDRDAAQERLIELRDRLDHYNERRRVADSLSRNLTRSCETLRAFRSRYEMGWFRKTEKDISLAEQREDEARANLFAYEEDKKKNAAEKKRLDAERRDQEKRLRSAQEAERRLSAFVEEYFHPAAGWRKQLEEAESRAREAAQESLQWDEMAAEADQRAAEASKTAQEAGEQARVLESIQSELQYVTAAEIAPEPGPLDELKHRYQLLRNQYEEKVGVDALLALAKQNDDNARDERARLAKFLSKEVTEEIVKENLSGLDEPDTVDELREDAEVKASSLQGRMGNLKARVESANHALQEAEEACKALVMAPPLKRAPSVPDLAEAEAGSLEKEAKVHQLNAEAQQHKADDAKKRADATRQRISDIERSTERLRSLKEDYADLLEAGIKSADSAPHATLEETMLTSMVKKFASSLRNDRGEWQSIDTDRGVATATLRSFAASPEFEHLDASWLRHFQEHDEPALEEASENICAQLELRRKVLDEQISGVERHRTVLIDELQAVAEEGMKLLRQASNLSRLPDHVPGIGGAHFLRIQTKEPDDPVERRSRMADLIDELLEGRRDIGGVPLVQAAVRRLARPVQVRVLHPDPALDRRTVSIPEMARSSGGEQLTGAILLYCTLARVRGRSRGLSRRASSVLILDNPIGRASRVRFLELQRDVARAMGVQLIYTTGVNDHEALRALPNIIRLRNERVDRNSGRRLVEHTNAGEHLIEAVRIGRREKTDPSEPRDETGR